ncbi:hypothetical protein D1013_13110 [Euzebyella marina]|uniref:Heme oxygenase n=1 Tax=Euzebyella marina TaxID=1761453 RepID=A0A3G2L7L3_9FLAO|nr:biliverdin-producing heme oxygenase [Euzebyella marina]AYN68248.1 hypothetical protein D1013_13110 [Euzebyella marina]
MTILDTIKKETKSHHQQVETVLVSELKSLKTKDDYAGLLARLYSFYKPIEDEVHRTIDAEIITDISKREHTSRIVEDLQLLEHREETPLPEPQLTMKSLSYALGVLYVMEGSTMGGQIISKMIHKNVDMNGADAVNYFSSYGDDTHKMWAKFKIQVIKIESTLNHKEVISGAEDTFNQLRQWLLATKPLESTSV